MQFYNPFKPHVIKQGDLYYVRKLDAPFSWVYLESSLDDYWWHEKYKHRAYFVTSTEAFSRLKNYKNKRIKQPVTVIKEPK